jgi:cytochrome c-type biogenesis protein CcmH/NrfG
MTLFSHAVSVTRDNAVALGFLGRRYLAAGEVEKAASYLEESVRLAPTIPDFWLNLGIAQVQAGHPERAAVAAEHVLGFVAPDPAFLFDAGLLAALSGRSDLVSEVRRRLSVASPERLQRLDRWLRERGASSGDPRASP